MPESQPAPLYLTLAAALHTHEQIMPPLARRAFIIFDLSTLHDLFFIRQEMDGRACC